MQHLQYLGDSKCRVTDNSSTTVLVFSWGMWLQWVLIVKGAWWKKPCKHRLLRLWKISSYLVWYALAILWELFLCLLGQINTNCQYKLKNSCSLVVLGKGQNLTSNSLNPSLWIIKSMVALYTKIINWYSEAILVLEPLVHSWQYLPVLLCVLGWNHFSASNSPNVSKFPMCANLKQGSMIHHEWSQKFMYFVIVTTKKVFLFVHPWVVNHNNKHKITMVHI